MTTSPTPQPRREWPPRCPRCGRSLSSAHGRPHDTDCSWPDDDPAPGQGVSEDGLAKVAEVLAAHEPYWFSDYGVPCWGGCECQQGSGPEVSRDAWPAHVARAVLDAVQAEVGARALEEAADDLDATSERIGGMYAGDCTERLRARARALRGGA